MKFQRLSLSKERSEELDNLKIINPLQGGYIRFTGFMPIVSEDETYVLMRVLPHREELGYEKCRCYIFCVGNQHFFFGIKRDARYEKFINGKKFYTKKIWILKNDEFDLLDNKNELMDILCDAVIADNQQYHKVSKNDVLTRTFCTIFYNEEEIRNEC